MEKKALLMAGLLTTNINDINYVKQFITGESVSEQEITEFIKNKNCQLHPIDSSQAGNPSFCNIDLKHANILDRYTIKIRKSGYFSDTEWFVKSVEIGPLVSSALFLDEEKIELFYNLFVKNSYSEILDACLDIKQPNIYIESDGKGFIYHCENGDITHMENKLENGTVKVTPVVNISPVKIIRVGDKYRIVDGHCRAVALKKAGYDFIPAIVIKENTGGKYRYTGTNKFSEHMLVRENPPIMKYFLDESYTVKIPLTKRNLKLIKVHVDSISINI